MYKIKEFSLRSGVPIDTLKYYDSIDLFKPLYVNPENQYRYYDANQLHDIHRILVLKESHCSLDEIKKIMDSSLNNEQLSHLMHEKVTLLENEINRITQQLNQLYTNIFMLKNGGFSLMQEVIIKDIEEILVVSQSEVLDVHKESFDSFCGRMWGNIESFISEHNIKKSVPCMSIYYSGFYVKTDQPVEMEVAIPVITDISSIDNIRIYNLPKVKVASIVHQGAFDSIGKTYDILLSWLNANNYQAHGPVREIYHKGEWITKNINEFVTEIQIQFTSL